MMALFCCVSGRFFRLLVPLIWIKYGNSLLAALRTCQLHSGPHSASTTEPTPTLPRLGMASRAIILASAVQRAASQNNSAPDHPAFPHYLESLRSIYSGPLPPHPRSLPPLLVCLELLVLDLRSMYFVRHLGQVQPEDH